MKNVLFFLFFLCSYATAPCQISAIDCAQSRFQFDRMLQEGDTTTALILFEALAQRGCSFNRVRHYEACRLYYSQGQVSKAKEQMQFSVEKGMLGSLYYDQDKSGILQTSRDYFGDAFTEQMLQLNEALTKARWERDSVFLTKMKDIYDSEQELRRDKAYKTCRNYNFRYRLGFPYDSTLNHVEMMACSDEFRYKDSLLLAPFVAIIDSLGYVPSDEDVFGLFPISPTLAHTAHYDFAGLEKHLLRSVELGKISPSTYGWWKGSQEEYYQLEFTYYFTHSSKMLAEVPEEKIAEISAARRQIGLPPCPAVLWNTKSN